MNIATLARPSISAVAPSQPPPIGDLVRTIRAVLNESAAMIDILSAADSSMSRQGHFEIAAGKVRSILDEAPALLQAAAKRFADAQDEPRRRAADQAWGLAEQAAGILGVLASGFEVRPSADDERMALVAALGLVDRADEACEAIESGGAA